MPKPKHLVVAEDVSIGKPAPECYLLGMARLGLSSGDDVLVVEDSTSGVKAGKAAGCKVLAVVTTHSVDQLAAAGADWIVPDLTTIGLAKDTDRTPAGQNISGARTQVDISICNAFPASTKT